MNVNKYIGEQIKKNRIKKNITQQELAEFLNISTQAVSRYELGSRKTDNDILFKLANYFKISINDFFPPTKLEIDDKHFDTFYNLNKYLLTDDDKEHIVFMINKRKKEKQNNSVN